MINRNQPTATSRQSWDELDKTGGLEALRTRNPEAFKALYIDKFGKEPATY